MKKLLLCFLLAGAVFTAAACKDKSTKEDISSIAESTSSAESEESSEEESLTPIVSEESSEEESLTPIISEESSEEESLTPIVSEESSEEESLAPIVSEESSEEESLAPIVSEESSEEESLAPIVSEESSEEESLAPIVSEESSEEESLAPIESEDSSHTESETTPPPPPPADNTIAAMLNQQDRDYHGYSAEELDAYFEGALITGDSVTNGLKLYTQMHEPILSGAYFHTGASYGFNNAVAAVTPSSQHPLFRGQRSTIWDVAAALGSDKVIIGFGLNDFGYCNTARIETCLDRIVSNLRAVNSDIEIIFLSSGYFTRNGEVCRPEMSDYRTNQRQRSHNQFVLEYCNENGFDYIDVTHCFSDAQGYLKASITLDDYCHPRISEYTAWRDILYSYAANKLMGTYQNPPAMG